MQYKITRRQYSSRMCFVCGLENPHGLRTRFYETVSGELIAQCTPCEHHQSYPGRLHGGVSSSLLDEAMGRAVSVGAGENIWGVTIDLTLRYRQPVPYGKTITVVARVDEDRGRMFTASGELYLPDGTLAVSATGRYLRQSAGKITVPAFEKSELLEISDTDLPDIITIPEKP